MRYEKASKEGRYEKVETKKRGVCSMEDAGDFAFSTKWRTSRVSVMVYLEKVHGKYGDTIRSVIFMFGSTTNV